MTPQQRAIVRSIYSILPQHLTIIPEAISVRPVTDDDVTEYLVSLVNPQWAMYWKFPRDIIDESIIRGFSEEMNQHYVNAVRPGAKDPKGGDGIRKRFQEPLRLKTTYRTKEIPKHDNA